MPARSDKVWDYAVGMLKTGGLALKPTLEMIEKEKRGEMTTEEIGEASCNCSIVGLYDRS